MTTYDFLAEWNRKGEAFAREVNEMVKFGETHGWDNWKGKEPEDTRDHLAEAVLEALRKANRQNTSEAFRESCPPAHAPFIKHLEAGGQSIADIHLTDDNRLIFLTGAPYQNRQAYIIENDIFRKLERNIISVGKSHHGNCFAIADAESITTWFGWKKIQLYQFNYPGDKKIPIKQLIPFNDGSKVLLVSSHGIYVLSEKGSQLIHPVQDPDDEDWSSDISMEHAALSHNNLLVCVGDQDSQHRVLDDNLDQVAEIGPYSEYPHFALYSKDDTQLIMNSCHFYSGATIGIATTGIEGVNIEAYTKDERLTSIDDSCRVYAGITTSQYYILGDASGYIRAFDKNGNKIWRHFLGSTVSGMAISEDETTLYVGCYSGILHKLILNKGHRDKHTIGNGAHYEEFRLIFWKNEPTPLRW